MERFFFHLSDVISDRMPRVSDVYRAQGAPYEQYQPNLAYIRNNPNLAYIGNRREYQFFMASGINRIFVRVLGIVDWFLELLFVA